MGLNSFVVNYDELTSLLNSQLQSALGTTADPAQLQFLGVYVNMLSSLAENELFYSSMLMNESFLSTAILPDSILRHAYSLGYTPQQAIEASGNITLYIPIDTLQLPQFQVVLDYPQFTTSTGVIYTSPYIITLNYNSNQSIRNYTLQTNYQIITQNAFITQVLDPTGKQRTVYVCTLPVIQSQLATVTTVLSQQDIAQNNLPTIPINLTTYFSPNSLQNGQIGTIQVYVNNSLYTQVNTVFDMQPNQQVYVVEQTSPTTLNVLLGNGYFGNTQLVGETIVTIIPLTLGSLGNVLANTLSLSSPLQDQITGTTLTSFITHPAFTNGSSAESYSQIRTNAINSLTQNNRLVTQSDFQTLAFSNSIILDGNALVKQSDLSTNNISLFIVPELQLPTGNRPLLCTSGVLSIPKSNVSNTDTIVVTQGQPITVFLFDYPSDSQLTSITSIPTFYNWYQYPTWSSYTTWYTPLPQSTYYSYTGISPFEIHIIPNPLSYKIYYLTTNTTIPLTPNTQTVLPSDMISTGYVNDFTINWNPTTANYDLEATITLSSPMFTSFTCPQTAMSLTQAMSGISTSLSTSMSGLFTTTITDLNTNSTLVLDNWTVSGCSLNQSNVLLSLTTSLSATSITFDDYQIETTIAYPYMNNQFVVYDAICPIVSFKTDFSQYVGGGISATANYYNLFDIWAINGTDWNQYNSTINSVILTSLQQLIQQFETKRMLTSQITLALAKTDGLITNYLFNTPSTTYTYNINTFGIIQLPLKIELSIVVASGYDPTTVISQVQSAIYSYIQNNATGFEINLTPTMLTQVVLSIPGVFDCTIISPVVPIVYNYNPQKDIPSNLLAPYVVEYLWIKSQNDVIVTYTTQETISLPTSLSSAASGESFTANKPYLSIL